MLVMEYFVAFNSAELITMSLLLCAVSPLSWAGPDDSPDSQLNRPARPSYIEAPVFDPVHRPAKRQARTPTKEMYSSKPK